MSTDPEATATLETAVGRASVPGAATSRRGSAPGGGSASTATVPTTPREAMRVDEFRRMRLVAWCAVAACAVAAAALVPMGGNRTAKTIHMIGLLGGVAAGVWVLARMRTVECYRTVSVTIFFCFLALALASAFPFWGVFSSCVLFVPIVIFFVAATESWLPSVVTAAGVCVPHGVLGVGVSLGLIEDVGVVRSSVLDQYERLAVIGLAQFAFVASFLLARMFRRSNLVSLEQLESAVRDVSRREALLAEVRQELERALHVGGPGLYTGQHLGSFVLGNVLGRGSMGEVYEAGHADTGEPAAIKVLTPGAGANPDAVRRFIREVEIAASLDAANVVRVLEVPRADGSVPYLAMERLSGESLAEILRRAPRMSLGAAVELVKGVAAGAGAAHAAGIVHRDLKPRNIFRHGKGRDACWKILDFGVSKLTGHQGTLTQGQLIGTPQYMAPEQARGDDVDERSDLYAIGVIAYRVLTGLPAFGGRDVPTVLYAVTHSMPPRPTLIAPELPPVVDDILAVAMAKDPGQRFASVDDLVDAFEAAAAGKQRPDLAARAARALSDLDWGQSR